MIIVVESLALNALNTQAAMDLARWTMVLMCGRHESDEATVTPRSLRVSTDVKDSPVDTE